MKEANSNCSGPEPGTTRFSAAQGQGKIITMMIMKMRRMTTFCWKDIIEVSDLPDPTARMPAWGGLMMAQNCLIPKGPPKFDTVNVPPCKESKCSIQQPNSWDNYPSISNNKHKNAILTS